MVEVFIVSSEKYSLFQQAEYSLFQQAALKNALYFNRQKTRPPSPGVSKQRPPSPTPVSKPAPIQRPSLTPSVINITKKKTEAESKPKDKSTEGIGQEQGVSPALERDAGAASTKTKEGGYSSCLTHSCSRALQCVLGVGKQLACEAEPWRVGFFKAEAVHCSLYNSFSLYDFGM